MHKVAVLILDGVVPFDLSVPCGVFGFARLGNQEPAYEVRVCGAAKSVSSAYFQIQVSYGLSTLRWADTIVVPGLDDVSKPLPASAMKALKSAAARGARIASICSGTFILAEAGLLDGLKATTHWVGTAQLEKLYPGISVDPNVLYVDNGQILTSAGAAAGLDLCLHMVRRDFGAAVAAESARMNVMPLERPGGQSQFIVHAPPAGAGDGESLQTLLLWMEKNLHRPLRLPELAKKAAMSPRTLSRRFHEQTGTTPLRWLLRQRIRQGQQLLESTRCSVEEVSERLGFGSGANFRDHFRRQVGVSPQTYRHHFRGPPTEANKVSR
jgi:transcriptional regulator GlxA family with amidase domain